MCKNKRKGREVCRILDIGQWLVILFFGNNVRLFFMEEKPLSKKENKWFTRKNNLTRTRKCFSLGKHFNSPASMIRKEAAENKKELIGVFVRKRTIL